MCTEKAYSWEIKGGGVGDKRPVSRSVFHMKKLNANLLIVKLQIDSMQKDKF